MILIFLPVIETIINHALKADPDALAKITQIKNQVVEIHCEDWNMKFYMVVSSHELQFYKKYSEKPDTIVRGTLNNFLHIFIKGADSKTLFHYPIEIEGNTHNIEVLRDAFKNLDIDFEEKLSHFLGDSLAHKIMFHAKETKNYVKRSAENITNQTEEFIHCEAKNLISHKQVEKFYEDVAKLRDDVERFEAKIK